MDELKKRGQFTVDLLLQLRQPTTRVPVHLSPDARKLIISAQRRRRGTDLKGDQSYTAQGVPREMVGSQVLVVDTVTGKVEEPFPAGSTSWGAQWSPDGTKLAGYVQHEGDACLGVWDRKSNGYTLYRDVLVRPFFGFEVPRWTPDGRFLVLKLVTSQERGKACEAEDQGAAPVTVFSFNPEAEQETGSMPLWADRYRCDLARVDVETGEVLRLAEGWSLTGWRVAPDGRSVAALRYTAVDQTRQQFYWDLTVLPIDGGESRVVARKVAQNFRFTWSPDSRHIAYITEERGDTSRLFVASAEGSTQPRELGNRTEDMELAGDYAVPLWSEDGRYVYCLARRGFWELATDGSSQRRITATIDRDVIGWIQPPAATTLWTPAPDKLLHLTRNPRTKDTGLVLVDMRSGDAALLAELPRRSGWHSFEMEAAADGWTVYMMLEAGEHPAEVWQFHDGFRKHRRLLPLNANLDDVALGASRLLEYRTLDGERRQAALVLPAGYTQGQTVPVVVDVYGGGMGSNHLYHFGGAQSILHAQLLSNHGYAVLYPDVPLKDRDPLRQLPGQVLPAVNCLLDLGLADPKRIGLMGHSYGGYCTLALLTQTDVFRAAVASAGFYDLVSAYGAMHEDGTASWLGWSETGQGRMGGPLWDKRDAYIENSPIFYLDRVQTPVLLTCGSKDAVPPAQAEAVFIGLRRLGKKVELRRYEGEDHWPGVWSERSYRDLCERVLAWFDEHLKA